VVAQSFERIHRSNLVGMGVLPLAIQGRRFRANPASSTARKRTTCSVASNLNAFRIGEMRVVGKIWETMMERDGELAVNADKRASDLAGLDWQVVSDGSPEGDRHAEALTYFTSICARRARWTRTCPAA
jgi:phage gp29-like protein